MEQTTLNVLILNAVFYVFFQITVHFMLGFREICSVTAALPMVLKQKLLFERKPQNLHFSMDILF